MKQDEINQGQEIEDLTYKGAFLIPDIIEVKKLDGEADPLLIHGGCRQECGSFEQNGTWQRFLLWRGTLRWVF